MYSAIAMTSRLTSASCGFAGRALAAVLTVLAATAGVAAAADTRLPDAMQRQDRQAVSALLAQHADAKARQADGTTALAWAAHWNDLNAAEALLTAGADVNAADDLGVTPLALACQNGSTAMAERLLAAGADPQAARKTGETALMTAAFTGNVALVRLLLARGADVNRATTDSRQTALMWAIAERHPEVTTVLLAAKADVRAELKNKSRGEFVVHFAPRGALAAVAVERLAGRTDEAIGGQVVAKVLRGKFARGCTGLPSGCRRSEEFAQGYGSGRPPVVRAGQGSWDSRAFWSRGKHRRHQ